MRLVNFCLKNANQNLNFILIFGGKYWEILNFCLDIQRRNYICNRNLKVMDTSLLPKGCMHIMCV